MLPIALYLSYTCNTVHRTGKLSVKQPNLILRTNLRWTSIQQHLLVQNSSKPQQPGKSTYSECKFTRLHVCISPAFGGMNMGLFSQTVANNQA